MNLSPSPNRIAKVCVCIVKAGKILMVSDHTRQSWTLPGGGVDADETLEQAAVREAWEEAGATVKIGRALFQWESWGAKTGYCFEAHLIDLESSPEGREVQWIDPLDPAWAQHPKIQRLLEITSLFGDDML